MSNAKAIKVTLNNTAELKQYWLCTGSVARYQDVTTYSFKEIALAFNGYNDITMVIEDETYLISKKASPMIKVVAGLTTLAALTLTGLAAASFVTGG